MINYNGNTTSKTDSSGTTNYTWDYENRLKQVTLPNSGGTVTFLYDPFGRREWEGTQTYVTPPCRSFQLVARKTPTATKIATHPPVSVSLCKTYAVSALAAAVAPTTEQNAS